MDAAPLPNMLEMLQGTQWEYLKTTFKILAFIAPVVVPILLLYLFQPLYLSYRRLQFLLSREYKLLEIKVPKEISRSPAGMEIVFHALLQTGVPTAYKSFVTGEVRPWWSLELVSIGGEVHFFIWTEARFAEIVKHQTYAQYPDVEIYEVPDYTNFTEHDPTKTIMWGTYFTQTKDDVLPIKTYVDFGLDKNPKPEQAIDPLASTLEYLGSMRRGEQVWIQILIQPIDKEEWKGGDIVLSEENQAQEWRNKIDKYIKEDIKKKELEKYREFVKEVTNQDANPMFGAPMEPGTEDFIKQLKSRQNKYPFKCAIRAIYIAEKEAFRGDSSIPGLIGSLRQFNNPYGNGFKLGFLTDVKDYHKNLMALLPQYEEVVMKKRRDWEESFLEAYKLRSYFYVPYDYWQQPHMVKTTDELATLFHFPGSTVETPTFKRIESKKAEPPANLPV